VLRKLRDPFAVGMWFGGLVILANLMLCISVNAADRVLFDSKIGGPGQVTDLAVATFATLLCMLYTILAGQVLVFRSYLMPTQMGSAPPESDEEEDNEMVFVQRYSARTGAMMEMSESLAAR
jgi:hypothetical protein